MINVFASVLIIYFASSSEWKKKKFGFFPEIFSEYLKHSNSIQISNNLWDRSSEILPDRDGHSSVDTRQQKNQNKN